MASIFDFFGRRGNKGITTSDKIIEDISMIKENESPKEKIYETPIDFDYTDNSLVYGEVQSITGKIDESVSHYSPERLTKVIENDEQAGRIISDLRAEYKLDETFRENEEMARDAVVGSAMEIMADDTCQVDEKTKLIVSVESEDEALAKFLQDFLENNVNVEDRIWEWCLEVVKHGDFKLRRMEYYIGSKKDGVKNVYYENVMQPYRVTRVEYMGRILGYIDEDKENNKADFEKPETFVHFMTSKLSKREKVTINIKNEDDELEQITCHKVHGTSIMDNARYIFRVVNLLDNMLILSRVARSTQYNLVKIEVGNSSPAKTQQILSDVRRRLEGSTKLKTNNGIKTDPSPIPVNSNVYIPTRDGKGDITVDSVNESVDVRSITDIDYFRNKEFATVKVPKQYAGFEDALNGSLGNNSLVKLDIRYARSVQRVQTIMRYGIEELCNNYLIYRGRKDDVGKFDIRMRPLSTAESIGRIEEHIANMQAFDSMRDMLETYDQYIDKAKLFKTTLDLINISPTDIASEEFIKILKELEDGSYKESNHKKAEAEKEEDNY